MDTGDRLEVERLGGFAGFGLPGSHLRSRGVVDEAQLSAPDRAAVDKLFAKPPSPRAKDSAATDGFRYRLTRHSAGRARQIEAEETELPACLRDCVSDELI